MKYLYLAEKPSVMRQVRDVYTKHRQEIISRVGEIDFIALAGHVCRYLKPNEYPQWSELKWSEMDLPIIPKPFAVTKGDTKNNKEILKSIKDTLKKETYDGIIVGTDSDVEGNGIYYLISKYLHLEKYKTLRFFERSLTEKEILDSLFNLTDFYRNTRDVRMTECYIIRSHFDWLVGMNATIGVTVKCGELYRIGRVKAPTLKLVYDNSNAIDRFTPHSDYLIKAFYEAEFTGFQCDDDGNPILYTSEHDAANRIKELQGAGVKNATVRSVERKDKKTPAPQLYMLSQLQGEAGSYYNFTPDHTLELVQSLYEKQFVSYPRTDGMYISTEKAKTLPQLVKVLAQVPTLTAFIGAISPDDIRNVQKNRRVVNDEEVQKASHDALLPTENVPDFSKMSEDEKKIYDLICRRLAAQFFPDMIECKTVLMAEANGNLFKSTGSSVTEKGWSQLYNRKSNADEIPNSIKKGDSILVTMLAPREKKSTPPKRLTQAGLVLAMENIAKYMDEKNLKKIMKDAKGLGTQATRGKIIHDLIESGYMESKTKSNLLYITDKGKRYIDALENFSITNPIQAAKWESMFQGVKNGNVTFPDAEAEMIRYTEAFIKEVDKIAANHVIERNTNRSTGLTCPWCGKLILKFKWGYACEDSRNGCGFSVSAHNGKLTDTDMKTLLAKGVTKKIKNICRSSKTGQTYDARVKLCAKGSIHATVFDFA